MGWQRCWRCGVQVRVSATVCSFVKVGGPPIQWDITRYGDRINVWIPNEAQYPKTMTPHGRTTDGADVTMKAHTECYRLLKGIIEAARSDPDRRAAFDADHPTAPPHTRQQAAAGVPAPEAQVVRDYGEASERTRPTSLSDAADLAVDAAGFVGPTLGQLRLRCASIPLINEEALEELAARGGQVRQELHDGQAGSSVADADGVRHSLSPPLLHEGHTLTLTLNSHPRPHPQPSHCRSAPRRLSTLMGAIHHLVGVWR